MDMKIIAYTAGTHYDRGLFLRTIYNIQKARKDILLDTTGDILGDQLDHADLCSEMGHNARQTAEKYYDWVLLANRLEGCFNDVINEHRQSLHVRIWIVRMPLNAMVSTPN